jgi:hypothetical protein
MLVKRTDDGYEIAGDWRGNRCVVPRWPATPEEIEHGMGPFALDYFRADVQAEAERVIEEAVKILETDTGAIRP